MRENGIRHTSWRRSGPATVGLVAALIISIGTVPQVVAQYDVGAAALTSVGGAYSVFVSEPLAVWYNPALAGQAGGQGEFGLSYRHLFEIPELEEIAAGGFWHARHRVTVGFGATFFGEAAIYEEFAGLATVAVNPFANLSLGAGLRYRRAEFGNGTAAYAGATLDLGAAWRPDTNWVAPAAVREITVDDLYGVGDPGTVFDISLAWTLPPDLTIGGRWSKESDGEARFGVGQMLRINRLAYFLSGLRFDPIRYALGVRLIHRALCFDYSYENHPDLGGTHTVGMAWSW